MLTLSRTSYVERRRTYILGQERQGQSVRRASPKPTETSALQHLRPSERTASAIRFIILQLHQHEKVVSSIWSRGSLLHTQQPPQPLAYLTTASALIRNHNDRLVICKVPPPITAPLAPSHRPQPRGQPSSVIIIIVVVAAFKATATATGSPPSIHVHIHIHIFHLHRRSPAQPLRKTSAYSSSRDPSSPVRTTSEHV